MTVNSLNATPIEAGELFSSRDFRDALSTFATGVTIVTTTDAGGEPVGMTASSFNSVSTEPPLVLWSVTKTALSAPTFRGADHFAIHVLSTDQTSLSNHFAKSGADKFAEADFHLNENNVPILAGCATRFDCKTWAIYEGGDHWIIVGEVKGIERSKKEGLVFGGGAYSIASPLTIPAKSNESEVSDVGALDSMLFYHLSRAYHQLSYKFHAAVRKNGLTLAEWRVLANLHGEVSLSYSDLSQRTFLDPLSLSDLLLSLHEEGLCILHQQGDKPFATGTKKGAKRVEQLFDLGKEIEAEALRNTDAPVSDDLIKRLKQIVSNMEAKI